MLRVIALACVTATVVACSSQDALPTDAATGLPILDEPPPFRGSVAALEWRESHEPAKGLGRADTTHASVADLVAALRDLAAEEGVELAVGFLGAPAAREATLVVHVAGTQEAIAGEELVADLRLNERGWYVDVIRYRTHCRRGIDPEAGDCS